MRELWRTVRALTPLFWVFAVIIIGGVAGEAIVAIHFITKFW